MDNNNRVMDFPNTYTFRPAPRSIGELCSNYHELVVNPDKLEKLYPWATRFVCGYPVPDFQRELKWSPAQKIKLIQSIWLNIDIGTYLLTDGTMLADGTMRKFSDMVIDGQQRLSALEDYFADRLAVPDVHGAQRLFSEITEVDRRFFRGKTFSRCTVESYDEVYLKNIYNLLAFGGVAHEASERAA